MHIVCLESQWFKKNPVTVQPFLETLRLIDGISYERFPCNSVQELEQHLSFNPHGTEGILYLAMHGRRGKVSFSATNEKNRAPIEDIAQMMDGRYAGWHIHLSNCSVLNVSAERYYDFKKETGATLVSGYVKDTDFIESYAMDMLLFYKENNFTRKSSFVSYMYNNYGELMTSSGLYLE